MLQAIGIGDLHLDGKLSKHISNLNEVILDEVGVCHAYARRHGIQNIFYYGDICDVPTLSNDAMVRLLDMFAATSDLRHFLITGNHDVESVEKHSLQVLKKLVTIGKLDNVRIIDEPTVFFTKQGTPVNFLPWPHFSVQPGHLNVLHVETNGSKWEIGKPIVSERETEFPCVAGHLHTNQTVGPQKNIHYSGTLYQTNFGEKREKFFHHLKWDGVNLRVKSVPHVAKYELLNLIVNTREDLERIESSPFKLYKVFVKSGADLDASTFNDRPNVIKINSFSSKEELNNLIAEELILSDANTMVNQLTVHEALETYLLRSAKVEDASVVERAKEIAAEMFAKK
jgi:DNA repair exonuclease SbcCD nuclease subunit